MEDISSTDRQEVFQLCKYKKWSVFDEVRGCNRSVSVFAQRVPELGVSEG